MIHINTVDTWDDSPSRLYPLAPSSDESAFPNEKPVRVSPRPAVEQLVVGHVPAIHETLASPTTHTQQRQAQDDVLAPQQLELPSLVASVRATSQLHSVAVTRTRLAANHGQSQGVLKQGRLLCTKTVVWYTSRQQRQLRRQQRHDMDHQHPQTAMDQHQQQREIERQETRLSWREFRAVLRPNALELFLVSPLLLHGPRLAHVIYFSYDAASSMASASSAPRKKSSTTQQNKQKQQKTQKTQKQASPKTAHRHGRPRFHASGASVTHLSIRLDDSTIMLQHENKSGGRTTYALQAPTARAAHDWYMALYQCIPYAQLDPFFFPDTRCTKPLWPKFIDIRVPWLHPAIIRLPLDTLDDALNGNENDALASTSSSSSIVTINAQDLKRCLYAMLNDMADADDHLHQLHHHHHHEHHEHHRQRRTPAARQRSQWLHLQNPEAAMAMRRLALCWHHRGNTHESSSQTGAQGRMEWINDDASILGPQCINKEHTLELHDLDKEMATDLPPDLPTMPRPLEDFLLQSTEDGQFKKARQQQRVYAVLEGHFLFLMEPGKAKLPANASPSVSTDARARTWFAHAASSIPQLSKKFLTKASLTHTNMFRRHHRHDHDTGDGHDARGRPQSWLSYASSTHWEREHLQELMRRGEHIAHAFAVIDLTLVSHVAPVRTTTTASASLVNDPSTASTPTSPSQQDQQQPSRLTSPEGSAANLLDEHAKRRKRLFQLVYAGNTADTIQFEASSAQAMFEWLRRLRKAIAYAHAARDYGIVQTQAKASLWYRRMDHPILQSGLLFARLDGQKTYRRYLCVLVRGHGLFLHRYRGGGAMMQRYRHISLNNDKATYAFGADRPSDVQAPRHQQTRSAQQPHEPELAHVFTLAGAVTRPQLHECAFILWQRYSFSRNHVVMLVREHLSHLKLGHRLGRKGATFSFLADSQNDKEAWLWAIQHEMDQYCYT